MSLFRKAILIGTVFLIVLGASAAYIAFIWIPEQADEKARNVLRTAGFTNFGNIQKQNTRHGFRFTNIDLDQDGFSTLGSISFAYNPLDFLTTQRFQKISVDNLSLSGEIANNLKFDIAGFTLASLDLPSLILASERFDVQSARLDMFHDLFGSLRFDCNIFLNQGSDGRIQLQSKIKTNQKPLELQARLTGEIAPSSDWSIMTELHKGRIDIDNISASRITANITSEGQNDGNYFNHAELNIGSLKLWDTVWSNTSGTLEHHKGAFQGLLAGQGVKDEALELTIAYSTQTPDHITASIFAPDIGRIISYFETSFPAIKEALIPEDLHYLQDIFLTANIPYNNASKIIRYNIKEVNQTIENNGTIEIKGDGSVQIENFATLR